MKLTPAEELVDEMFGKLPANPTSFAVIERQAWINRIRKIQANALRWAFDQHVSVEGYAAIIEKANQLDPLLDTKRNCTCPSDEDNCPEHFPNDLDP